MKYRSDQSTPPVEFEIVQDYNSLSMEGLCNPLHSTSEFEKFMKYFSLYKAIDNLPLYEAYHFLDIGNNGGICQPQVNHHVIESDIEPSIREKLEKGDFQSFHDNDTQWTIDLVLLSRRSLDRPEIDENEMGIFNMETMQLMPNRACRFATADSFPWKEAKDNIHAYASNEKDYEHPRPTVKHQITEDDYLPYATTKKDGTRYFWAVLDGLQRSSAIMKILNADSLNKVGNLRVKFKLYALRLDAIDVPQRDLCIRCFNYSKEVAKNNHVISSPSLCSELSAAVMTAGEKLSVRQIDFREQSIMVLVELINAMKERFQDGDLMKEQLGEILKYFFDNRGNVDDGWKNVIKPIVVTRKNVRMLYTKGGDKKQEWMLKILPHCYSTFLYCLFICYCHDSKFLVKFQRIKRVFDDKTLGKFF
jgi:hypothetical protein